MSDNNQKIIELIKELENVETLPNNNQTEEDIETYKSSQEAENYLLSHEWCDSIEGGWLALSWGYILGVFLYKITSNYPEVDDYVWIVVGDIPPAYVDIESAENPHEAIESYVEIMSDWVECVESGKSLEDCYPVEVPATKEYASMLKTRLSMILEEINSDSN